MAIVTPSIPAVSPITIRETSKYGESQMNDVEAEEFCHFIEKHFGKARTIDDAPPEVLDILRQLDQEDPGCDHPEKRIAAANEIRRILYGDYPPMELPAHHSGDWPDWAVERRRRRDDVLRMARPTYFLDYLQERFPWGESRPSSEYGKVVAQFRQSVETGQWPVRKSQEPA